MNDISRTASGAAADQPVLIPIEGYTSEAYARAENDKLWAKVWQVACRAEEVPRVGDYVTYDILDESIIVVRTAVDRIEAFYNVCQHRGRRLTEGCGHTAQFYCRFHGWRWELNGENAFVLDPEDWGSALNKDNLRLKSVKADTWGGWVFVNMDPASETLADYLESVPAMLDPFEIDKMRYRWRQWLRMPCNWKTAVEAFIEGYHVQGTHPQLTKHSTKSTWSRAVGRHGCFGAGNDKGMGGGAAGAGAAKDARTALAEVLNQLWEEVNATTTQTIVDAANRLADELPAGTPPIEPKHLAAAGQDWHLFPNSVILQGPTFLLGYRARPDGYDPQSCIFEVYVLDRFPEGEAPRTEWEHRPVIDEASWRKVLCQDFSNMEAVQKGMMSRGFAGPRPNPVQERPVTNFHRVLASYMGTGAPQPIP